MSKNRLRQAKKYITLGASLKDLGEKWFTFSKMHKSSVESILRMNEFAKNYKLIRSVLLNLTAFAIANLVRFNIS